MKKVLGIIIAIVVIVIVILFVVSSTSKKLVCKSNEGNITLMYDDNTIKGYTASGITYNLDEQKKVAEQLGMDEYLNQFSDWFSTNTTGTCTRKE